jgi:PAS domain S-box-containing protein
MTTLLAQALDALLEFTNATCGWVGLHGPTGELQFMARRGEIPQAWLDLQQGKQGIWGFAVRDGPTLLNELPVWPLFGAPVLTNLLSCPLTRDDSLQGHVALANKPHGFSSHDVYVVQAIAHLISKQLTESRRAATPTQARPHRAVPPALQNLILDRMTEGILVVDGSGGLIYANETWADWTGFALDELLNQRVPFPFWVGHRDLASPAVGERLASVGNTAVAAYPFRRRDESIFWCQAETLSVEEQGRRLIIAFLQRAPEAILSSPLAPGGRTGARPDTEPQREPPTLWTSVADRLPFAAALTDGQGHLVWLNDLGRKLWEAAPSESQRGRRFQDGFAVSSAALLEDLFRGGASASTSCGRLILEPRTGVKGEAWVAYWLALPAGGFLFAWCDDWEALCPPDEWAAEWRRALSRPVSNWLALVLRPGRELVWWDERWGRLTGLATADLGGVACEVALDWLFPRQLDRDFIADLLHQPANRPPAAQAVLHVVSSGGSRPKLCTFLRVADRLSGQTSEVTMASEVLSDQWLLLVGEPQPLLAGGFEEEAPGARYLRQFARGMSHLLNHYLTTPTGVAETALDRGDLPADVTSWFQQILESCGRCSYLISSLRDLAADDGGDARLVPLADLVRAFVEEHRADATAKDYQLVTDLRDLEVIVRVNRRMFAVVLAHLLRNAEQALVPGQPRRITVRAFARDDGVCCEIEDTGEGLTTADWTVALAPFISSKGPFARDAVHAALEATGLGLTVSHHLVSLHGGRLELHSTPGEGTTALVILPRAANAPGHLEARRAEPETVRTDPAAESHGPHAKPGFTSAVEPDRPA